MEIPEILHQFERVTGAFPHAAVDEAVARREEIIPELLRVLADTVDRAEELAKDQDYMAHVYAMFLLAQFREERAYPLVVRFALLPTKVLDGLFDAFLTSGLGPVLASVCGGDLEPIRSIVENGEVNQWARVGALQSFPPLLNAGKLSRAEVVGYFGELFRGKLERAPAPVWDELVTESCLLYPEELLDDINRAFAEDLVDTSLVNPDSIEQQLEVGKDETLAQLYNDAGWRLVEDTAARMSWWACFQDESADPFMGMALPLSQPVIPKTPIPAMSVPKEAETVPLTTFQRSTAKTGRNDPCPCGSGKKYKKCCGA